MPPRQKTAQLAEVVAVPVPPHPFLPVVGDFVHVVINGQTRHKGAELLHMDENGIAVRTDVLSLTKAEISYIPWSAIEGLGLIGKR